MVFNFDRFSRIAASVYDQGNLYTLEQCLEVFRYYFQTYEKYIHSPHPPIRREQIAHIMWRMPWVSEENRDSYLSDVDPETYPRLIDLHFKTLYRRCDYNVNHFFSGKIRELRIHEAEKGYV